MEPSRWEFPHTLQVFTLDGCRRKPKDFSRSRTATAPFVFDLGLDLSRLGADGDHALGFVEHVRLCAERPRVNDRVFALQSLRTGQGSGMAHEIRLEYTDGTWYMK